MEGARPATAAQLQARPRNAFSRLKWSTESVGFLQVIFFRENASKRAWFHATPGRTSSQSAFTVDASPRRSYGMIASKCARCRSRYSPSAFHISAGMTWPASQATSANVDKSHRFRNILKVPDRVVPMGNRIVGVDSIEEYPLDDFYLQSHKLKLD